jgi:hypothetical protein
MVDLDTAAKAIRVALAFAAFLLAGRYIMLPVLCAGFRQRVFRLRRELFLLRIDGIVDPDLPAYRQLYATMNGALRFAESITLAQVIAARRTSIPAIVEASFDDDMESVPEQARMHLAQIRCDLGYEMMRHLVVSSPLLWPLLFVFIPLARLVRFLALADRIEHVVHAFSIGETAKRLETKAVLLDDDGQHDSSLGFEAAG